MSRHETFTFRVTRDERRLLGALAARLVRTESDALRWLLRVAAQALEVRTDSLETRQKGGPGERSHGVRQ